MNDDYPNPPHTGLPVGLPPMPVPPGMHAGVDHAAVWGRTERELNGKVLKVWGLPQFLDAAHRRGDKVGLKMIPLLSRLEELFKATQAGCPCTRRNREQHAEFVFRDTMIRATIRDKQDIKEIMGVGELPEDYERVIITSEDTVLLDLKK